MVGDIIDTDFEALSSEVHPAARGSIRNLLDSLDEEWNPFIPETFRNDISFTRNGYWVKNTFLPDMLEVVIRVHRIVKGDAWGMLTVKSHEKDGVVEVDCIYTMAVPEGFSRWSDITGEHKSNPVTIESRQVRYPEPSEGDTHSDVEIREIVQGVSEAIHSLVENRETVRKHD